MAVYVDDAAIMYKQKLRYHLVADSVPELHEFCEKIGVKRCWYHPARGKPHYDITGPNRDAAIAAGAIPVSRGDIVHYTQSGQKRVLRMIEKYAGDEVEKAKWMAFLAKGFSQSDAHQQELF